MAAALLLAGACLPTRTVLSRVSEPSAIAKELRADSFARRRASLVVQLSVQNPGPSLTLSRADYEVLLQGRSFATGTRELSLELAQGGQADLTLPIDLAYLDLPGSVYAPTIVLDAGIGTGRLELVVRGSLRGQVAQEPISVEFAAATSVDAPTDSLR